MGTEKKKLISTCDLCDKQETHDNFGSEAPDGWLWVRLILMVFRDESRGSRDQIGRFLVCKDCLGDDVVRFQRLTPFFRKFWPRWFQGKK